MKAEGGRRKDEQYGFKSAGGPADADDEVCDSHYPVVRGVAEDHGVAGYREAIVASRYVGGRHYREATRARSDAEFISKIEGGLQELDEAMYWMELILESGTFTEARMSDLIAEADELTAILVSCVKKVKERQ